MFQIVGAGFHYDREGIGRELCKGEEGFLASVDVPAVRHADRTDRERGDDGGGQDACRPGAEGEETELLQRAFYVILGKPGDDRAGFRIEDVGAVKFLGDALHALFQFGAAVLNIRDEIDFNGKGQVICGHVNKLLSKSIDFLYIGMLR